MPLPCLILLSLGLPALPVATQGAATLATKVVGYRVVARAYRLDGVVEAIRRTAVSAETSGQLQEIFCDADFVEMNAVVARLRDAEHQTRVTQAAAELKSATAQLQQTEDDCAPVEGLQAKVTRLGIDSSRSVRDPQMHVARHEYIGMKRHRSFVNASPNQCR